MVKKTLGLILFWSLSAQAHVTVLSSHEDCGGLLLQRSVRGLRLSLETDPTDPPPRTLSLAEYRVEALESVAQVRAVYGEIFRRRGMSAAESARVLADFDREDSARIHTTPGANGLDNTVYFVNYEAGVAQGVLRATLIRQGEARKLPLESQVTLPDGNRVELERFLVARGRGAAFVSREILLVAAQFFKNYFAGNKYKISLLTDESRARLYHSYYAFDQQFHPELPELRAYLCQIDGAKLYDRYIGHVERAYAAAFQYFPMGKESGLSILRDFEAQPGMHDYVPNLVAQAVVLAAHRNYAGAIAMSDRLKRVGHAEVNDDYYILWKSRALYDPIHLKGDGEQSLALLHAYLAEHPLQTNTYNNRALLFLLFELKILFGLERFTEARALVLNNYDLLMKGKAKLRPLYLAQWNMLRGYAANRNFLMGRRIYLELMWDLSTQRDPFATSVLHAEAWQEMARVCLGLGDFAAAARFERIAAFWAGI